MAVSADLGDTLPDVKSYKCAVHGDFLGQERRLQSGKVVFALVRAKKRSVSILM